MLGQDGHTVAAAVAKAAISDQRPRDSRSRSPVRREAHRPAVPQEPADSRSLSALCESFAAAQQQQSRVMLQLQQQLMSSAATSAHQEQQVEGVSSVPAPSWNSRHSIIAGLASELNGPACHTHQDRPMSIDENIEASLASYQQLLEWNARYDAKVSTIISVATGMLGGIGAVVSIACEMPLSPLGFFLVLLAIFPLLAVFYHISRGATPDITPPDKKLAWQPEKSLLFFGGISQLPLDAFSSAVHSRTREAYLADLLDQQHQNSRILSAKFGHLQQAYRWLWLSYGTSVFCSISFLSGACLRSFAVGDQAATCMANATTAM